MVNGGITCTKYEKLCVHYITGNNGEQSNLNELVQ